MKNVSRKKESYERPQMEIILLEAKNAVLTSCTGNEASPSCPNGDSNEEPGCVSGYVAPVCPSVCTQHSCTLVDDNCETYDPETGCIGCNQATYVL